MAAVNHTKQDTSPHGIETAIEHAYRAGLDIRQKSSDWLKRPIAGLKILEIGPGPNFGSTLTAACFGAEVAVADRWLPRWDDAYHRPLYSGLADRIARNHPEADPAVLRAIVASAEHRADIIPMFRDAEELAGAPSAYFDLVYSNATFEHIVDEKRAIRRIFEVLKPGGTSVQQIDLRDHRDFSRPLEYLLMSPDREARWLIETEQHCGCQRRRPDYERAFSEAGFETLSEYVTLRVEDAYFVDFLPRLRKTRPDRIAQAGGETLLRDLGMSYVHRKPA